MARLKIKTKHDMEGVIKRFGLMPGGKMQLGEATLHAFEFKEKENPLFNLRMIMDGTSWARITEGEYVRLIVGNDMMMSDTPMERRTNREFVQNARGRVLIAGLGVGLILQALKAKIESGEVTSVTVIEKSKDVAGLIAPYLNDIPFQVIVADIFDWRPGKGEKFDTIYFDIWPTISEGNLPEMAKLHQAFKGYKAKGGWMDSWMCYYLRRQRAKSRISFW